MGLQIEQLPPPVRAYAQSRLEKLGITWPAGTRDACEMRFVVQAAMSRDGARALKTLTESGGSIPGLAKTLGLPKPVLEAMFRRWMEHNEPYPIQQLQRNEALEAASAPKAGATAASKSAKMQIDPRLLMAGGGLVAALILAGALAWFFGALKPQEPVLILPDRVISAPPEAVVQRSPGALRYGVDLGTAIRRLREAGVDEVRCGEVRGNWVCLTRDGRDAREIVTQEPAGANPASVRR